MPTLFAAARSWCTDEGPLAAVMDDALVIDATSVTHQYYCLQTRQGWSIAGCCRHLVPPAAATFVWTRAPEIRLSHRHGAIPWDDHSALRTWGVLIAALDLARLPQADLHAFAAGQLSALEAQVARSGHHATQALQARSLDGLKTGSSSDRLLVGTAVPRIRILDGLLAWTAPSLAEVRVREAIGCGLLPRWSCGSWLWGRDEHGETSPLWAGNFWVDAGGGIRDAADLWLHGEPLGPPAVCSQDDRPSLAAHATELYLPLLLTLEHITTGVVTLSPAGTGRWQTGVVSGTRTER